MKTKLPNRLKLTTIAILLFSLSACKNDSNSNSNTTVTSNYNGVNTEAVLTIESVNKIISSNNPTSTPIFKTLATEKRNQSQINVKSIHQFAKTTMQQHLVNTNRVKSKNFSLLEAVEGSHTVNCDVSGTTTIDVNQNVQTGESWLSIISDNCKNADGSFSDGSVFITTLDDTINPENNTLSIEFDDYIQQDSLDNTRSDGYIRSTGDKKQTTTMDLVIEDRNTSESVKFEDVIVTTITDLDKESVSFSGKIYNSKEGYITIKTTQAMVTYGLDSYPSEGQILIMGASAISGKKAVIELSYLPGAMYTIRADLDGDGVYEIEQTCNSEQQCLLASAP